MRTCKAKKKTEAKYSPKIFKQYVGHMYGLENITHNLNTKNIVVYLTSEDIGLINIYTCTIDENTIKVWIPPSVDWVSVVA